jgi:hypothetical protein
MVCRTKHTKKRHIADTNWRDCARKILIRFSVEQPSQEFTYRRHSKKKRKRTRKQNEKEKKIAAGSRRLGQELFDVERSEFEGQLKPSVRWTSYIASN